jgi:hypothetical protein
LLHNLPSFFCSHHRNGILFTCSPYPYNVELGSSTEWKQLAAIYT